MINCDLQDSFIANILRLIQKMKPKKPKKNKKKKKKEPEWEEDEKKDDQAMKRAMFPGLAMPNSATTRVGICDRFDKYLLKIQLR